MTKNELIIDDDYCNELGNLIKARGAHVEYTLTEYIKIMEDIKNSGIISGDVADALQLYIEYTSRLKNNVGKIADSISEETTEFLTKIDEADQYLF